MKRVLLLGFDLATVDFSDLTLPPGMTAEKIHAGVNVAMADFAGRGWHSEVCFINSDETDPDDWSVAWRVRCTTA